MREGSDALTSNLTSTFFEWPVTLDLDLPRAEMGTGLARGALCCDPTSLEGDDGGSLPAGTAHLPLSPSPTRGSGSSGRRSDRPKGTGMRRWDMSPVCLSLNPLLPLSRHTQHRDASSSSKKTKVQRRCVIGSRSQSEKEAGL